MEFSSKVKIMPPITDSDTKNRGERSSQTSSSLLAPAIIAIILQLVIATLGVTVYFTATGGSTGGAPAGVLYSVSGISLLITLGRGCHRTLRKPSPVVERVTIIRQPFQVVYP